MLHYINSSYSNICLAYLEQMIAEQCKFSELVKKYSDLLIVFFVDVIVLNYIWYYYCFSYYDGDQEKLFNDAHVVNPFSKMPESVRQAKVMSDL